MQICEETGNLRVGSQVQHRLGTLHFMRGELDSAAAMYARVLEVVRETGDRIGQCYALLGLAEVDISRAEVQRARHALTEALELLVTAGNPMVESQIKLAMAQAELADGRLDAAAEYADRAVNEFKDLGAALLCAQALVVSGRISQAAGSPRMALAAWEAANAMLSGMKLRDASTFHQEIDSLISGIKRVM
jgi:tetratricopeptide (TPR) repeat protein